MAFNACTSTVPMAGTGFEINNRQKAYDRYPVEKCKVSPVGLVHAELNVLQKRCGW